MTCTVEQWITSQPSMLLHEVALKANICTYFVAEDGFLKIFIDVFAEVLVGVHPAFNRLIELNFMVALVTRKTHVGSIDEMYSRCNF